MMVVSNLALHFTITDTENGTLIDSDLAQGTYSNTSVTRNIPTPPVELMAQPDYGDFIDLFGNPGNPDIQNKDDAATVGVLQMVVKMQGITRILPLRILQMSQLVLYQMA